jgi:tripeptidyl-peptidase-2
LESTYPDDIALLEYKMNALWTSSEAKSNIDSLLKPNQLTEEQAQEIIQIADTIAGKFNEHELLEFYGRKKPDNETDEQKEQRKENDNKKKQLVNALKNKAMAYAALLNKDEHRQELDAIIDALQQWSSDDSNSNLASLLVKVKRDREASHPATALKSVQKYLSEVTLNSDTVKDVSKVWSVRNELYKELGWSLWAEYDDKWSLIRQPPYSFALF